MNAVAGLLSSMRLSGGVFLDAEMRGQWAMLSQFTPEICMQFFPVEGSLISYHFVREGKISAEAGGMIERDIPPGSILLFPSNHDHRLFNSEREAEPAADFVLPPEDDGPARLRMGEGEPVTRIFCGFLSATSHDNPLLSRLPPMLVLQPDGPRSAWIDASIRFAAAEAGEDPAVVGKLAELMFSEAVRLYLEEEDEDQVLASAISDPALARALDHIHAHFADDLEVEDIARAAGLSRTVLGERFVAALGEPPMRYCARYRMRQAGDLLRAGKSATQAAFAVGFSSEAAFARAFKREYGKPPAAWARDRGS